MFTQSSPIVCPQSWDVRVRPAIKSRVAVCIRACYYMKLFINACLQAGRLHSLAYCALYFAFKTVKQAGKCKKNNDLR